MRRRMADSHLGIILFEFAFHLREIGYAVRSLHQHLARAEHFSHWMKARSLRVSAINEAVVERFLNDHLPRCRCPKPAPKSKMHYRSCLRLLLSFLRQHRGLRSKPPGRLFGCSKLLLRYDDYLHRVAGLTEGTRDDRLRHAREFLRWRFGRGRVQPKLLRPADSTRFILLRAHKLKPRSVRDIISSLRSLLRFLHLTGRVDRRLAGAVVCPPPWPHSPVPDTLAETELKAFLHSFDRSTPLGRRDFAIALCLCRLGLHGLEVASLWLEDINWPAHTLQLRDTKSRRARLLPLPADVGKAMSAYIEHGRPPTTSKVIFVRHLGAITGAPWFIPGSHATAVCTTPVSRVPPSTAFFRFKPRTRVALLYRPRRFPRHCRRSAVQQCPAPRTTARLAPYFCLSGRSWPVFRPSISNTFSSRFQFATSSRSNSPRRKPVP